MNETCRWSDTEHTPGPIGNTCDRGTGRTRRSAPRSFRTDHAAGDCQGTPRTRRSFCTISYGTRADSSHGPGAPCAPIGRRASPEPPSFVLATPNHTPIAVGQRPHSTVRAVPSVGIAGGYPITGRATNNKRTVAVPSSTPLTIGNTQNSATRRTLIL